MKSILKYPGAKNRLADWICSYIPKHEVWVELFAGSSAITLNKERCHIETINDLHGEIVNFFQVVRDYPEELARLIYFTPFSREEYAKSYEACQESIERARRWCVRCWQGFGAANAYKNGFKSGQQSHSPNPAAAFAQLPETILEAAERLRGVQIENLPAVQLLKRYNTKDVFVYADPPYPQEMRKKHLYKYEMDTADQIEFLTAIQSHPGKVLVSSYENDLYNQYLEGWRRVYKDTNAEGGLKRTEVLYMNYSEQQMSIFDYKAVMP